MKEKPKSVGIDPDTWAEMQHEKIRTGKQIGRLIREAWEHYKRANFGEGPSGQPVLALRGSRGARAERLLAKLAEALESNDAREEVQFVEFALQKWEEKRSA